ncbi:hypothetical protein RND71_026238 [Anisodus tanguticus]|uniref:Uncharacterized protein n=1 Tax=Anisodus tanguticus TaxID=243964 RepID=A0AAE1RKG9_9SOLA|nr:hypothetical protein RND71_026238 [Anisodus tanguticus]
MANFGSYRWDKEHTLLRPHFAEEEKSDILSQTVGETMVQEKMNENLVFGDLHVSGDATVENEQDEVFNKDNVKNTTVQSGNHVPSNSGKRVDESSMEFYGSICEMDHSRSNILESEADIIVDIVDTVRAMKNSERVASDLGFMSV